MRRFAAVFASAIVIVAAQGAFVVAEAAEQKLTYSVKEARAYAAKGSLMKEVIEAAPKCKPEEDQQYACTDHNHKPNCPKSIEIGPTGKVPEPAPPKGVEPQTGRAGEGIGDKAPPQSSPVRINRLLSLAKISHLFDVKEAGGLASSIYTDNSGRSEPEAHAVSEGFSNSIRSWEERCYWHDGTENEDAYEHFLSRSGNGPDTYHLSECVGRQCQMSAGINIERARQIIHMTERNGKLFGAISSEVHGINLGGQITIESVTSYIAFETDGTEVGLKWEVASRASEPELAGNPIPLPPGDTVQGSGYSVGVSEPFVEAAPDGGTLTVIAPGLHVGSDQQAALLGGAELYMSAGRQASTEFESPDDLDTDDSSVFNDDGSFNSSLGAGGLSGSTAGFDDGFGQDAGEPGTLAAGETGEVLIFEKATGIGAVAIIVALGGFCWVLLLSRWLQRYTWGQKLTKMQPFKFFDWMYRAFVKT